MPDALMSVQPNPRAPEYAAETKLAITDRLEKIFGAGSVPETYASDCRKLTPNGRVTGIYRSLT
jgi:hypothetical protein